MKTRRFLFFASVIMMIAVSCRTVRILPSSSTKQHEKITTTKTLKEIDALKVVRKADTAKISARVTDLSEKPMVLKSKHATIKLRKVAGKIHAECISDELRELIKLQKEIINTYKEMLTQTATNTVVETTKIPQWAKPFLWIGLGAIIVFARRFINFKITKT